MIPKYLVPRSNPTTKEWVKIVYQHYIRVMNVDEWQYTADGNRYIVMGDMEAYRLIIKFVLYLQSALHVKIDPPLCEMTKDKNLGQKSDKSKSQTKKLCLCHANTSFVHLSLQTDHFAT